MGKTYILKQFGSQEYTNFLYLNFENNPRLYWVFEASLDPHAILKALSVELNVEITEEMTLLIFDEI